MNLKKLNEEFQKILNEQNNRPNLTSFIFKNYLNPDGQNYKGRETYASTLRSVLEEMERLHHKVRVNYAGGTTAQEQFKNHCENIWKHATVRDSLSLNSSRVKKQPGLADAIKALHNYQQSLTNDLANLNKWNGKEWVNGLNQEIEELLSQDKDINKPSTFAANQSTTLYSGDEQWPLNIYLKFNKKGFSVESELNGEVVYRTKNFETIKQALDAYIDFCKEENDSTDIIVDLIENGAANFLDNTYANYLYDNLSDIYYGEL